MTAEGFFDVDDFILHAFDSVYPTRPRLQDDLTSSLLDYVCDILDRSKFLHARANPDQNDNEVAHEMELDVSRRMQAMLIAIRDRTSSRAGDEAIVIATYLNLDASSILNSTEEPKMVALIKSVRAMPIEFLFAVGQRIEYPGFHWAPKSFMSVNGGGTLDLELNKISTTLYNKRNESVPQILLIFDQQLGGLWALTPAVKLNAVFPYQPIGKPRLTMGFRLDGKDYGFGQSGDDRYHDELLDAKVYRMCNEGRQLTILTLGTLCALDWDVGILVEVLGVVDDSEHGQTWRLRYCMTVGIFERTRLDFNFSDILEESGGYDGSKDIESYVAEWVEPRYWLLD